jgi:EAL domain-containing protein (putative c-di-GMP-specific phosphodiesterase class I)
MRVRSAFIAHENFIFINLSGQSLANSQFLSMIIVPITQTNIDASNPRFDITETTAASNFECC